MDSDILRPPNTPVKPRTTTKLLLVFGIAIVLLACRAVAATFSGNAQVYSGANSALTWDAGSSALSVSCWFKLVIPSGTNLTEDMTILVNQHGYAPNGSFAYLVRFNIGSGNIEFVTRGSLGFTNVLIERPYLERWYHVAVVRSGESVSTYVDGRAVFNGPATGLANSANGEGLTVGGWGSGRYLFGEVQEVAVAQVFRSQPTLKQYMFQDQAELGDLTGYYKLGFSTNVADRLRNFVPGGTTATTEGPGLVEFEETTQSGEQSAFDSRRNGGRDALSPLSGAFSWEQVALSRPAPGIAFDFRFGYSSGNAFGGFKLGSSNPFDAGPFGPGWRHSFETRLLRSDDFDPGGASGTIGLMNWNGSIETWDLDLETGAYNTRQREYRGEFTPVGLTKFQWVTPERLIYVFQHPALGSSSMLGRLLEIRDFNSNSVKLFWNQSFGIVTQVVDSAQGTFHFRHNAQRLLTNLTFQSWAVNFAYDGVPRLVSKSITNNSGLYASVNTIWQFTYGTNASASNLLERIIDPRGITNLLVQYDKYGRKTNEVDALGRTNQTRYGVPGKRQITRLDPAANSWIETYDRKGRILAQRDPLLNETSYTYDDAGNRTSITEPLGWKTLFAYDARANVIARTNALAEVTRWNFHSFFNKATNEINPHNWTNSYVIDHATGNLLRHFDDLGTLVLYTYKTNGLVDMAIDANGHTNRFFYDTNGFLIRKLDAAGFPTTFGYNDVGWKTSATNALNQRTIFEHDLNGQVVRTVDSLQREFRRTFDANGNMTSEYDAKNNFTSNIFDLANQRVTTTDQIARARTPPRSSTAHAASWSASLTRSTIPPQTFMTARTA